MPWRRDYLGFLVFPFNCTSNSTTMPNITILGSVEVPYNFEESVSQSVTKKPPRFTYIRYLNQWEITDKLFVIKKTGDEGYTFETIISTKKIIYMYISGGWWLFNQRMLSKKVFFIFWNCILIFAFSEYGIIFVIRKS